MMKHYCTLVHWMQAGSHIGPSARYRLPDTAPCLISTPMNSNPSDTVGNAVLYYAYESIYAI